MPLPAAAIIALAAGSAAAGAGAGASRRSAAENAAAAQKGTAQDIAKLGDDYIRAIKENEQGYQDFGQMGISNIQDLISSGELYKQYGDYTGELSFDPSSVDVTQDPGYAFRLSQGLAALDAGAGAKGQLFSGAHQKALMEYGQNLGSQEYQKAFDRNFGVFRDSRDAEYANYLNQLADYNQNLRHKYSDAFDMVGVGEASTGRLGTAEGNYLQNQEYATKMEGAAAQQEAAADNIFRASVLQAVSGGLSGAAGAGGGAGGFLGSLFGKGSSTDTSTGTSGSLSKPSMAPVNTVSGVAGTESGTATASDYQSVGGNNEVSGTVGTGSDYTPMVPINTYMGGYGTNAPTGGYDPSGQYYYGQPYGNTGQYGNRQPYYPR